MSEGAPPDPDLARRAAAVTAAAARPDPADPLHDVVAQAVPLPGGDLVLLRPRDPDRLPLEAVPEDSGAGYGDAVQELHPPHWARLWPAGLALARAVARDGPGGGSASATGAGAGRSVLELGCGLGLPALAAARAGARVLATDGVPSAAAFAAASAARNGLRLGAAVGRFDRPGPLLAGGPWDLVLAADVLYGQRALTELRALLPRLVRPAGEVWLADPGRPLAGEFLADARTRWREVRTVQAHGPHDPDTGERVRLHRLRAPRPA